VHPACLQSELASAREAQKAAKLKQRAEIARVEHDEFMRVLAVNRAKESEEMAMAATQVGGVWGWMEWARYLMLQFSLPGSLNNGFLCSNDCCEAHTQASMRRP
jgi:hypothetical protein